ncbi:MAG: GDP-mannose dehydrogenase [Ignavibacteria bacterium RBG_16_35_7]|nr:MAG: GDP-mannose dehydrogenase [Ignavibacteria bacterium RBG_16_35_7]
MNISIFGLGYVGCVSLGCLAQNGNKVIGVDVNKTKVEQINSGQATIIEKDIDRIIKEQFEKGTISATLDYKEAILNTEISIIAVGTPSTSRGHLNLEHIFHVAEQMAESLGEKDSFHVVVIRSTVMPGTCKKFTEIVERKGNIKNNVNFAVVANPEFLREGTAVHDYYNPPLTLIGADNKEFASKVSKLYVNLPAEIIITELNVAEIMKYVNNTFHALKISFANEIGNICHSLEIDSNKVMEIFVKDKQLNISPYYFKPGFAYGGSCLPKDLKGLQTLAHDNYVKVSVIDSIDKTNNLQIQKAIDIITSCKKKNLGFLGLSFKAGTDDLRNSPAVTVIETLFGKGYEIKIFDRNVHTSQLMGTNKEFIEKRIPHLSKFILSDASELIQKSDVIIVTTKEEEFIESLFEVKNKFIVDFVGLDKKFTKKENYVGISW